MINQAVDSVRTDLTSFALSGLRDASRRVLADRSEFVLRDDHTAGWDPDQRDSSPRPSGTSVAGARTLVTSGGRKVNSLLTLPLL